MTTYRLLEGEKLSEGVARVFSELADDALGLLTQPRAVDAVDAVHEARKCCKKARGLVRLVRPALGEDYHRANEAFRDAARELAPIRDPQAMLGTFDALIAADAELVPASGLLSVRDVLARGHARATEAVVGSDSWRLAKAKNLISEGAGTVESWSIPDDFAPVSEGIARTYRRGRKALQNAFDHPTAHRHHEWRKRVKYLWYQIRLIQSSAPSVLRPLRRRLHDLSDALGDAHDLAVMADVIAERDDVIGAAERDAFQVMAASRRHDLEHRARSLGTRLYVEKPKHFARRLEGYWAAWGDGPELPASEIGDLFCADDGISATPVRELRVLAREMDIPGRSTMNRHDLEGSLRAAGAVGAARI